MFLKYYTLLFSSCIGIGRLSKQRHLNKWPVAGPGLLHPSQLPLAVWLLRQGQLMVIIYEAWSRSITTDWKSLPVCTGWGWVGSVNSGTTVPHLLAMCFDQLTKTLCVHLCETSSLNRLIWKRTHTLWRFQAYTGGLKRPHRRVLMLLAGDIVTT